MRETEVSGYTIEGSRGAWINDGLEEGAHILPWLECTFLCAPSTEGLSLGREESADEFTDSVDGSWWCVSSCCIRSCKGESRDGEEFDVTGDPGTEGCST